MASNTASFETSSGAEYTGRVKWFNNKAGYGFVTGSDTVDYFVHHSGIKTTKEMYSYLVEGEYVSFNLQPAKGEQKVQAVDVTGVNGGTLMCETRNTTREARNTYRETTNTDHKTEGNAPPRRNTNKRPRRQNAPSQPVTRTDETGQQWKLVH
jgi:cold shock protein